MHHNRASAPSQTSAACPRTPTPGSGAPSPNRRNRSLIRACTSGLPAGDQTAGAALPRMTAHVQLTAVPPPTPPPAGTTVCRPSISSLGSLVKNRVRGAAPGMRLFRKIPGVVTAGLFKLCGPPSKMRILSAGSWAARRAARMHPAAPAAACTLAGESREWYTHTSYNDNICLWCRQGHGETSARFQVGDAVGLKQFRDVYVWGPSAIDAVHLAHWHD